MAPRTRLNQDNGASSGMDSELSTNTSTMVNALPRKVIDARNEQEFPSLGGGAAPINIRPTITMNMRSSSSGLARTKENFPALGGASSTQSRPLPLSNTASHMNASTLLFKTPAAATSKTASNQTKSSANNTKSKTGQIKSNDFPALPGGGSMVTSNGQRSQRANIESDLVEVPLRLNASAVSAKHRGLVQPFEGVSLAAATANQKIKTIQRTELKQSPATANENVPSIKSKDNFPALGGGGSAAAAAAPQWLNATNGGSKKQNQISKKLKVAPAPILPSSKKANNDVGNSGSKKDEETKEKKTKSKANDKKKETAAKQSAEQSNQSNANATNGSVNSKKAEKDKSKAKSIPPTASDDNNSKKTKQNNEKNATERNGNASKSPNNETSQNQTAELNGSSTSTNGIINSYSSVAHFTMPPPGFPAKTVEKANVKAPPGFENIPKNNQIKNISKMHTFMSPSNALQRNNVSSKVRSNELFPIFFRISFHFIHSLLYFYIDFNESLCKITETTGC